MKIDNDLDARTRIARRSSSVASDVVITVSSVSWDRWFRYHRASWAGGKVVSAFTSRGALHKAKRKVGRSKQPGWDQWIECRAGLDGELES